MAPHCVNPYPYPYPYSYPYPQVRRASYDAMMRWDFEGIAPAHGEPIGAGGKAVMAAHLGLGES